MKIIRLLSLTVFFRNKTEGNASTQQQAATQWISKKCQKSQLDSSK